MPAETRLLETPVYREYPTFEYALGAEAYARFSAFNGRACTVLPDNAPGGAVFAVFVADDHASLPILQAAYPDGAVVATQSRGAQPYALLFQVPPGSRAQAALAGSPLGVFGSLLELTGFEADADAGAAAPGATLQLTLAWRMTESTAAQYTQFVHLIGPAQPDGSVVYAQRDAGPCDNSVATWQWPAGDLLVDRVPLALPPDLPAGTYQLNVGWYDANTLQRLPLDGGGDSLTLREIEIATP